MTRWMARFLAITVGLGMLGGYAGFAGPGKPAGMPADQKRAAGLAAIERARVVFARAKAAGGEFAAPFEFYLAEEYLNLAVREASAGDKEGLVAFAEQSALHSDEALRQAEGGRR